VHPDLVRAGSDGDVILSGRNVATDTTVIDATNINKPAFRADCVNGAAIHGTSQEGPAILGEVYGSQLPGVLGIGYLTGPGVVGWSELGSGGTGTPSAYPLHTGVYGGASDDNGFPDPQTRGVHGQVHGGQGVRGEATVGIGVYATATTGTALQVSGKASFSRSGRATIASGHSYVDVTVAGGLAGTPLCFANLQTFRSGISVAAVRPNYPSAGKLRIYLSKAVTASTYVAWIVTN